LTGNKEDPKETKPIEVLLNENQILVINSDQKITTQTNEQHHFNSNLSLGKTKSNTIETKKDEPTSTKDKIKSVNKKLKENCFA
jgi:hypothetical protein